jgi:hypothetical protein
MFNMLKSKKSSKNEFSNVQLGQNNLKQYGMVIIFKKAKLKEIISILNIFYDTSVS